MILLTYATVFRCTSTHDIEATLTIGDVKQTKPILSPGRLFGSFFEDFLHAGEGGAYAERLSNRALAIPLSNESSFRCTGLKGTGECTWYAEHGSVTRESSPPLNSAVPHSMWLEPGAIASNAGFPGGIAVRAGESLNVHMILKIVLVLEYQCGTEPDPSHGLQ